MKERGLLGPGGGVVGGIGLGVTGLPAGINPHVLQQLGIEPPITNTVFVANVSFYLYSGQVVTSFTWSFYCIF